MHDRCWVGCTVSINTKEATQLLAYSKFASGVVLFVSSGCGRYINRCRKVLDIRSQGPYHHKGYTFLLHQTNGYSSTVIFLAYNIAIAQWYLSNVQHMMDIYLQHNTVAGYTLLRLLKNIQQALYFRTNIDSLYNSNLLSGYRY
jgi:hypothetical protein